jgi:multidrug resistance efflux pump
VIRLGEANRIEALAAYPNPDSNGNSLKWIGKAEKPFRRVMKNGETVIVHENPASEEGVKHRNYLVVIPIHNEGAVRAAAAFRIKTKSHYQLLLSHARLETTSLLLNHHEMRLTTKMHHEAMNRLRRVLEVLDVVNKSKRFLSAAMALCNEIATRLNCSRVSLGILSGRYVRVRAMSHTDTFGREMDVVQAIEAAMEECLDQDVEVIHPKGDAAMYADRAAKKLSESHGPSSILSLPIREDGNVTAVITLERSLEQPFNSLEEIETVRLIGDLCAPRLLELSRSDRWFGARMASRARKHVSLLLGHEHTWVKLMGVLVFLMVVFLATAKGDYRIKTSFALEAQNQQVVVAPFDTFTKSVSVEPGDRVEGGKTILGTLETSELRLKLAALKAEQLGYQKQMTASMRDRKTAEAQIAQAQSDKVAAEIRLIERKIAQADLVSPITGWVVSEDLKQQIGAPVETGKILFEIAGIDSLRAELYVPESSIANVATGQDGELASVGHPDQKVRFVIQRINPIAEVVNNQNVFRVRARILENLEWMRPGMEGEARISACKKSYLWIASHRLVNWLRMKLWV